MAVQVEQIGRLRALITGEPFDQESSAMAGPVDAAPDGPAGGRSAAARSGEPPPQETGPDVPEAAFASSAETSDAGRAACISAPPRAPLLRPARAAGDYLADLRAPALPPLDGVVSRGFAPVRGHYGLDLAADTGDACPRDRRRAQSCWPTGRTTAASPLPCSTPAATFWSTSTTAGCCDAPATASRRREAIALSGNTGEITSGPHLHVEVWRDGRPLDPSAFFSLH